MYLRGQMNGLVARAARVFALSLCAAAHTVLAHLFVCTSSRPLFYAVRTLIYCKLNNFVFAVRAALNFLN